MTMDDFEDKSRVGVKIATARLAHHNKRRMYKA